MSTTIVIDDQVFDTDIDYFYFHGYHEISDQHELKKLSNFPNIRGASLSGTNLNDVGLAHICAVATMENLNLQDTAISNQGIAHLAALSQLKYLRLKENSQLTNECVPHLRQLKSLVDLQIHETSINQEGLNQLEVLQRLKDICLDVWDNNYTFSGLLELSARMPQCTILAKGHGEFHQGTFKGEWQGDL